MITIMTPIFNRAYIISNLYYSLLNQTIKNFEWIIIDDGSTDNLLGLVNEWKKESNGFEICYIHKNNGGKHRAWNLGLNYINNEWTFIVDSDDYLTDDAIEKVIQWINQVDNRKEIGGVSGCRGKNVCERIGSFPKGKQYIDASNLDRYKFHLQGDKAEIYRTDVLRRFPFPEFEGEKFIAENAVFGRIARAGYKVRWFPDIIYICDYLDDGLTKNVALKMEEFFHGYTYMIKESDKYCNFPVNYISIGRFSDVAQKKGLSKKEGRNLIEVNALEYEIGRMINSVLKIRNNVRNIRKKRS